MIDIPPCIFCKYCKIGVRNGIPDWYFCRNSFELNMVSGIKSYNSCIQIRDTKECNFESTFFYKIITVFGIINRKTNKTLKDTAQKIKWHDLRKNPKDLPKTYDGKFLVYTMDNSYIVCEAYKICGIDEIRFDCMTDVIAWAEIPLFIKK